MASPLPSLKYFLYARKSSEGEDQQVASIDSQITELQALATRDHLEVVAVLAEAQSAKAPGRPVFNQMLARIGRGEAAGILCWKLDRLARNPVDGGNVSWMLQQGLLQRLQTHERAYCPADNVLMMSVEFGMANQFVRDLSQNVKRGLRSKVEHGWYPGVAKPGYLNDPQGTKGGRTVHPDPQRFPLLQRAFQLVVSGQCTPPQVLERLNREWGYQTPQHRKLGGRPLARASLYRILTDPFYYGLFEFPKGSGNWFQGKHPPMITEEAFWRVQQLLGRAGRPRPQRHTFAYTGLMQCGQCRGAITAERKDQVICPKCKVKFSTRNRTACPKCTTPIAAMRHPTHLHYVYYHCTRRKKTPCTQGAVEVHQLEAQIVALLDTLTLSEPVKNWCVGKIAREGQRATQLHAPVRQSLQQARENVKKRLDNLLKLKISPQNDTGELLSDEEFAAQRSTLTQEAHRLEQQLTTMDTRPGQWQDTAVRTFNFACYARAHFEKGTPETRRAILSALGSNLILQDRKLRVSWHKHLALMQKMHTGTEAPKGPFEPEISGLPKAKNRALNPVFSTWCGKWDDVRTYFQDPGEALHLPDLKPAA